MPRAALNLDRISNGLMVGAIELTEDTQLYYCQKDQVFKASQKLNQANKRSLTMTELCLFWGSFDLRKSFKSVANVLTSGTRAFVLTMHPKCRFVGIHCIWCSKIISWKKLAVFHEMPQFPRFLAMF